MIAERGDRAPGDGERRIREHANMNEATQVDARGSEAGSALLKRYGCGPMRFSGTDDGLYEHHLLFDDVIAPEATGPRERFTAVVRAVRDVLSQR
jgi:glycogen phosphorylase